MAWFSFRFFINSRGVHCVANHSNLQHFFVTLRPDRFTSQKITPCAIKRTFLLFILPSLSIPFGWQTFECFKSRRYYLLLSIHALRVFNDRIENPINYAPWKIARQNAEKEKESKKCWIVARSVLKNKPNHRKSKNVPECKRTRSRYYPVCCLVSNINA